MNRILILADLHCGHRVGLTPRNWLKRIDQEDGFHQQRAELWAAYREMLAQIGPVDILVLNGDLVDGEQRKSGGRDLVLSRLDQQWEMAVEAVSIVPVTRAIHVVSGTEYHVGDKICGDQQVAKALGAHYDNRAFLTFESMGASGEDITFDIRHFIGGSSIPHGQGTPVLKEKVWNLLWKERGIFPKVNVVVRSHVHTALIIRTPGDNHIACTTPGLQGLGGIYGASKVSKTIDFGVTLFEVYEGGRIECDCIVVNVEAQKVKPYRY